MRNFIPFSHSCVTKKNANSSRKSNLKDSTGAGTAKTTVIQQRCIHPNGQNSIRMTTKTKSVTTTNAKNGKTCSKILHAYINYLTGKEFLSDLLFK